MTVPTDLRALSATQQGQTNHHLYRFNSQVAFVEALKRFHAAEAASWDALIAKAKALMAEALPKGEAALAAALPQAEAVLAPIAPAAKAHTIHCVGHAHIDMNWMWAWPETVATANDTVLSVLKLMDEFPTFTFSQSQASIYDLLRRYHPEVFARVKARVAEGRWEVTASHWVEGDKNIAGGEALCRHLLYTRRFMREHLGLKPEDVAIDWSPDTFGHAHTLPGIDARGGVRHYYMMRSGGIDRPIAFWWRGADGHRVLVYRDPKGYNGTPEPWQIDELLKLRDQSGSLDWLLVYGVGDHGGGPTRRDLRRIIDMDSWPVYPRWSFSTTRRFFGALEKLGDRLPVWERELNYEFAGCYTTQTSIKRNNRLGEELMAQTDQVAALAHRVLGRAVPAERLRAAWRDVLFSHFHDILPGSGVRATREYNSGQFQRVQAEANAIRSDSLRALAAVIDTAGGGAGAAPAAIPENEASNGGGGQGFIVNGIYQGCHVDGHPGAVVVFNPSAWNRNEVVTLRVWEGEDPWTGIRSERPFQVRDANGKAMPAQRLARGEYWGHHYAELAFPVEVGALGWTALTVAEGAVSDWKAGASARRDLEGNRNHLPLVNLPHGGMGLENEHLSVRFDRLTGGIVSLVDKASGIEFVDPAQPAGVLEYVLERPYPMSAWIIGDTQRRVCPLEVDGLDVVHDGPHLAVIQAKVKINDSRFTVAYALRAGSRRLDIAINGRWLERGGPDIGTPRLALRVPLAIAGGVFRCEIPAGSIVRDEEPGREVPALRWVDLTGTATGKPAGCAVLNDSKYGHSRDGGTLRVTLIRSSYDPDPLPEIGDHSINVALVPHAGAMSPSDLIRLGAGFNQPLACVGADLHRGRLPAALTGIDAGHALVTQVKPADDDDSTLIVRLQESDGREAKAQVMLTPALFGAVREAVEVDLLERPVASGSAKATADGFSVTVPPLGLASVKLTFR
jgi:alpha-mannosidase